MKNLRNINHWISELRGIAIKSEELNEIDKPMAEGLLKDIFSIENFRERFDEGLTPKQAFESEMEAWADLL